MKHTFEKIKLDQEKKTREKKKKRAWRTFGGFLLLIHAAGSGYAFYNAYRLGMLPGKLLFMLAGLLLIVFFINYLRCQNIPPLYRNRTCAVDRGRMLLQRKHHKRDQFHCRSNNCN